MARRRRRRSRRRRIVTGSARFIAEHLTGFALRRVGIRRRRR